MRTILPQWQKQNYSPNTLSFRQQQEGSRWHWLLIGLFGLLTVSTWPHQLLLLLVIIAIAALVNGPLMLLWGAVYSFLVSLFPPLAVVLSLVFLFLNLKELTKDWRLTLVSSFYYFYPLAVSLSRQLLHWEDRGQLALITFLGLLICHFALRYLYDQGISSRSLTHYLLSRPYELLLLLLPTRLKKAKYVRPFLDHRPSSRTTRK